MVIGGHDVNVGDDVGRGEEGADGDLVDGTVDGVLRLLIGDVEHEVVEAGDLVEEDVQLGKLVSPTFKGGGSVVARSDEGGQGETDALALFIVPVVHVDRGVDGVDSEADFVYEEDGENYVKCLAPVVEGGEELEGGGGG